LPVGNCGLRIGLGIFLGFDLGSWVGTGVMKECRIIRQKKIYKKLVRSPGKNLVKFDLEVKEK
jgi:hypothetical protein